MNKKGQPGKKHSEETKRKIGAKSKASLLGKKRGPMSDETKRKIGLANKNKVRSIELRSHFSAIRKGKRQSDSHRDKITLTKFGRTHSEESRALLSKASLGSTHSDATRRKLSIASTGRVVSLETRKKIRDALLRRLSNKCQSTSSTHIERILIDALEKQNVRVLTQVPILQYAVDIFLPAFNIVIEADGCRFHCCPNHPKSWISKDLEKVEKIRQKDKRKTLDLENLGFRVYRFWECEIHASIIACTSTLNIS